MKNPFLLQISDLVGYTAKSLLASARAIKLFVEVHFNADGSFVTVFVIYQSGIAGGVFKDYVEAMNQYNLIIGEATKH